MSQTPSSNDFVNSTTDRVASLAHETIDRVTLKANRAEQEVRGAAAKAADGARHVQEHAVEVAQQNVRQLRSLVERNPLIAAGIAFAAGAVLSALIRR